MTTPRSSSVLVLVLAVHLGLVLPSRRSGVAVAGGLEGGRVVHGFGVCMGRFSSVGPPKLALSRIRNRGWESWTKTRQDKARQDRERAPCLFRNRYSIQLPSARQVQSTSYWVHWILVLYDLGMPSCSSCRASGLRNLYLDSPQLQYSTVQYSTVALRSGTTAAQLRGVLSPPDIQEDRLFVLYVWSWGSFKVPAKGGRSEILEFHVRQKEVRE
jgi:hypothetical protein